MCSQWRAVKIFLLLGLVISTYSGKAQLLSPTELKKTKPFVSLQAALKSPDKVIKLDLWSANLREFPQEIFKFKNLQALNLNFNQIKSLPTHIYQLKYLQELRLGHNQFKVYPQNLEKLTHLRILDVHGNQLGSIPESIGKLKNLEKLHLHENQLESVSPAWTRLKKLRFVNLAENKLTRLDISAHHQLANMKMLILIKNPINQANKKVLKAFLKKVEVRF